MTREPARHPDLRRPRLATALMLAALACTPQPDESPRSQPGPPTPTMTTQTPPLAGDSPITLEDIATYPLPGTATPGAMKFSPDGRWLTWLDSPHDSLSRELFALELAQAETAELRRVIEPPDGGVTEDKLSPEEKLARERTRTRDLGVTSYAWARYADRMLIPLTGEIWLQDGIDAKLRKLVGKTESDTRPALDPRLSAQGDQVAFVRGGELWVVPADGSGAPKQLTTGVEPGKTRGLAEYIAAEEMGRHHGYWWSPDGAALAFIEVDETHIPAYRIVHQGKSKVGDAAQEDHGYPFAGADNARVRVGVVPSAGGKLRWLEVSDAEWGQDFYIARVDWMPDGSLTVQVEDRRQQELRLLRFADPLSGGAATTLITERSDVWINLHDMFEPLELDEATGAAHPEQVGGFIWASEQSGFMHLSLHAADGRKLAQLTEGEWMVEGIAAVDEAGQTVYFAATKDDPRERHVYAVGFDGQGLRKLTDKPGMHGVTIDRGLQYYVDTHSSLSEPPTVTLHRLSDGKLLRTLHPATPADVDPRIAKLELEPPEFVELTAADGTTKLYGAVYKPDPVLHGPGPYPTVVSVYGGPHAQRVNDSWGLTVDLRAQYLRDHGYLVFKLDNRGSARRGLAFEAALRHDMGNVEVQDQVAGVEWLVAQGLTDPARVAIYGWSYGGYMAAMALARAPETFQVAIAGAPVTHWDGYDTHYTERYMGLPQDNPDGYERSSVMAHVDAITGKLLLVHGLIDENVHFRHTARLIDALIAANKAHELQLYPNERHMPRRLEDRVYMERRIFEFLRTHLLPAPRITG